VPQLWKTPSRARHELTLRAPSSGCEDTLRVLRAAEAIGDKAGSGRMEAIWDGVTRPETSGAASVRDRQRLAAAAKSYDWARVIAVLDEGGEEEPRSLMPVTMWRRPW
jgi:hypothetical protein